MTHIPRYVHSSYLKNLIQTPNLKKTIDMAIKKIRQSKKRFDAVAFRGMSGALIAPAIALALDKSLILVRKDNEDSHSMYLVEGDYNTRRYLIVDDFIASGNTCRNVIDRIKKAIPEAKCVGILCVCHVDDDDPKERQRPAFYPPSTVNRGQDHYRGLL